MKYILLSKFTTYVVKLFPTYVPSHIITFYWHAPNHPSQFVITAFLPVFDLFLLRNYIKAWEKIHMYVGNTLILIVSYFIDQSKHYIAWYYQIGFIWARTKKHYVCFLRMYQFFSIRIFLSVLVQPLQFKAYSAVRTVGLQYARFVGLQFDLMALFWLV